MPVCAEALELPIYTEGVNGICWWGVRGELQTYKPNALVAQVSSWQLVALLQQVR